MRSSSLRVRTRLIDVRSGILRLTADEILTFGSRLVAVHPGTLGLSTEDILTFIPGSLTFTVFRPAIMAVFFLCMHD